VPTSARVLRCSALRAPLPAPGRYSARVLSVSEAMRAVLDRILRLGTETVALDDAVGRILASDAIAPRALPGFDNSAMDGYAARSAEIPATLPISAVIAAGAPLSTTVPPATAVRIFTGAPLPPELDTVVIQEDARAEAARVSLPASPPGENIRRIGEDIAISAPVLAAGTRLRPWDLGVLAALGIAHLPVARAPRVALIATGDELVALDAASALAPGQLFDSSMHALGALVREAGGIPHRLGIAPDEPAAIRQLLEAATAGPYDAVITTGGVSVGDRDHVRTALAEAGISLELWKVAMKPGKPFSFGLRATTPVFGLPGNPVSTIVGFELFLRPALLAMQGASSLERPRAPVRLPAGYRKQAGRAHYLRARVERTADGLVAHPHPKQGSAMLSSLLAANALIELAAELTEIPPGATAPAILLEAI
jgi:molybdopterin molybdotransferase